MRIEKCEFETSNPSWDERHAGLRLRQVSMHGLGLLPRVRKMSETVRETIKRVYDEACNYYQLFEGESDRGAAVLAHALFEHKLSEGNQIP